MNLPKYIPGLILVANDEKKNVFPDGVGMFVVASAFMEHEEWHYSNYDDSIQMHENEIIAVINQGYYIPAEKFNGVQEAPEYDEDAKKAFEEMLKIDAEEEAFIKESLKDHLADQAKKAKKTKKIKVEDGDAES